MNCGYEKMQMALKEFAVCTETGDRLSLLREDKESVSEGGVVWHLAREELKHCWGWGWGWQLRMGLKQHRC